MLKRLALSMVTVLATVAPLYAGGPELKTEDDKDPCMPSAWH